jgi:hypothetical protein
MKSAFRMSVFFHEFLQILRKIKLHEWSAYLKQIRVISFTVFPSFFYTLKFIVVSINLVSYNKKNAALMIEDGIIVLFYLR